ncbi:MAG: DNA-deoxyinosine glycosylase, partial [Planctomycetota bacterium]
PETEAPNDLAGLLTRCGSIDRIAFNGQKAESAFRRHVSPTLDTHVLKTVRLTRLPSTSPANAGTSFEAKLEAWRAVLL